MRMIEFTKYNAQAEDLPSIQSILVAHCASGPIEASDGVATSPPMTGDSALVNDKMINYDFD